MNRQQQSVIDPGFPIEGPLTPSMADPKGHDSYALT